MSSTLHANDDEFPKSLKKNNRFAIPWTTEERPNVYVLYKFATSDDSPRIPSQKALDSIKEMEVMTPNYEVINAPTSSKQIQLTWLGHAGFLLQFAGVNILFDPILSERIGPVSTFGTKRYRPCPLSINELPVINFVCISHDHYDHLDRATVIALNQRFGASLKWCVPLGMDEWFKSTVCKNINCDPFDWWENRKFKFSEDTTVEVEFVPAQHWCLRGNMIRKGLKISTDENTRLWGGWIIKANGVVIYHAGDTGYYGNLFKSIGKKHGPVDVALLPIGAYSPREALKFQHINPEEAVKIHCDIKSKQSIAMHWGTFNLSKEYFLEPLTKLKEAMERSKLKEDEFIALRHGETKIIVK